MKKLIVLLLALMTLSLCSCAAEKPAKSASPDEISAQCLEFAKSYVNLGFENTQALLDFFGENGKCAVDSENALQMTHPEKVLDYAANGGELEIYSLLPGGGFVRCDLRSGKLLLTRLFYSGSEPVISGQDEYALTDVSLTEKQSLIVSYDIPGNPESKYSHDGYVVPRLLFKTAAPDPKCAELCALYIPPRCYERSNLLTCDWSEESCAALDVSGAYDRLYYLSTGKNLWDSDSLRAPDDLTGELSVPGAELIPLLTAYLPLTNDELLALPEYDAATDAFRFFIFSDQSELDRPQPCAEVVAYCENADGTVTLTVDEVFLDEGTDCLSRSELTIRPMEDGSFRYISNMLIK